MKNCLVFIFGFLLLVSCNVLDRNGSTDLTNDKTKIISINFDTTGGGDIQFEISPTNSEYKINVTRYRYTSASAEIIISESTNTEVHGLLGKLFSKEIDIQDEVYKPEGQTGTWTTVIVNYDTQESVKLANVSVNNRLSVLYNYIDNESISIK